ncbi:hypothetical protein LX64_04605 [Chitinophaga skermanii]|uniref:Uncharacterized protein n=1 Tax=Chitinophaga skermanii TaxID=331697 RepID=A0A327Q6U0_9BACT|nr:hypothetical protein LX64_04605 [Chitinophaga skermanii]
MKLFTLSVCLLVGPTFAHANNNPHNDPSNPVYPNFKARTKISLQDITRLNTGKLLMILILIVRMRQHKLVENSG